MGFDCPHCKEAIAGAMSQETHQTRLNAKTAEIDALKAAVKEAKNEGASTASLEAEIKVLRGKVAAADEAEAFTSVGIPDPVRDGFRAMHASAMAGVAEADQVSLSEWITMDAARTHPLLASHYPTEATGEADAETNGAGVASTSVPATGGAAPDTTPAPAGVKLPTGDGGASEPVTSTQKRTPADVDAYLRSPEYRALPRTEQRAKYEALKAEVGLGSLFNRSTPVPNADAST